eukprot:1712400-Rhodomonas_salina.2
MRGMMLRDTWYQCAVWWYQADDLAGQKRYRLSTQQAAPSSFPTRAVLFWYWPMRQLSALRYWPTPVPCYGTGLRDCYEISGTAVLTAGVERVGASVGREARRHRG